MGSEFCFVKYGFDKNLNELTNEFQFDELSTGRILFRNTTNVSKFKSERYTAFLIGNIYNISTIRFILGKIEGRAGVLSDVEVLLLIREKFGNSIISIAEGDYCLFIEDKKGNIEVTTESRGLNLVQTDFIWITNSLKIVGKVEGDKAFDFKSESEVIKRSLKPDNFSPIRNVSRLKPGTINKLTFDEQRYPHLGVEYVIPPVEENSFDIKESDLLEIIDSDLRNSISRLSKNNKTIGVPLSGGLDSSLVTALASKYFDKVKT